MDPLLPPCRKTPMAREEPCRNNPQAQGISLSVRAVMRSERRRFLLDRGIPGSHWRGVGVGGGEGCVRGCFPLELFFIVRSNINYWQMSIGRSILFDKFFLNFSVEILVQEKIK